MILKTGAFRHTTRRAIREKMLDKTLADTYPASDPLSSIPDPSSDSLVLDEQLDFDKAA